MAIDETSSSRRSAWGFDADHPREEWMERGLCAQTDPESFFPEKGGSTRDGKRICESCEVRPECLEYALDHDERFGIWGGLSERERRRLKDGPRRRPLSEPTITGRCGTELGALDHSRRGERSCEPCRAAATAGRAARGR